MERRSAWMSRVGWVVTLALAFGLLPAAGWAEEHAAPAAQASLLFVSGEVMVRAAGGEWQPAQKGQPLPAGTEVKVGAGASAELAYDQAHSRVSRLDKEGVVVIDEAGPEGVRIHLKQGRLFNMVAPLSAGEHFVVKTPEAVASVRGTVFEGDHEPATGTNFAVYDQGDPQPHEVVTQAVDDVGNPVGEARVIGEGSQVEAKDGAVSEPEPVPPEKADAARELISEVQQHVQEAPTTGQQQSNAPGSPPPGAPPTTLTGLPTTTTTGTNPLAAMPGTAAVGTSTLRPLATAAGQAGPQLQQAFMGPAGTMPGTAPGQGPMMGPTGPSGPGTGPMSGPNMPNSMGAMGGPGMGPYGPGAGPMGGPTGPAPRGPEGQMAMGPMGPGAAGPMGPGAGPDATARMPDAMKSEMAARLGVAPEALGQMSMDQLGQAMGRAFGGGPMPGGSEGTHMATGPRGPEGSMGPMGPGGPMNGPMGGPMGPGPNGPDRSGQGTDPHHMEALAEFLHLQPDQLKGMTVNDVAARIEAKAQYEMSRTYEYAMAMGNAELADHVQTAWGALQNPEGRIVTASAVMGPDGMMGPGPMGGPMNGPMGGPMNGPMPMGGPMMGMNPNYPGLMGPAPMGGPGMGPGMGPMGGPMPGDPFGGMYATGPMGGPMGGPMPGDPFGGMYGTGPMGPMMGPMGGPMPGDPYGGGMYGPGPMGPMDPYSNTYHDPTYSNAAEFQSGVNAYLAAQAAAGEYFDHFEYFADGQHAIFRHGNGSLHDHGIPPERFDHYENLADGQHQIYQHVDGTFHDHGLNLGAEVFDHFELINGASSFPNPFISNETIRGQDVVVFRHADNTLHQHVETILLYDTFDHRDTVTQHAFYREQNSYNPSEFRVVDRGIDAFDHFDFRQNTYAVLRRTDSTMHNVGILVPGETFATVSGGHVYFNHNGYLGVGIHDHGVVQAGEVFDHTEFRSQIDAMHNDVGNPSHDHGRVQEPFDHWDTSFGDGPHAFYLHDDGQAHDHGSITIDQSREPIDHFELRADGEHAIHKHPDGSLHDHGVETIP